MTEALIIRADSDTRMGTGHVMRCLALVQAWQERGGSAVFLVAPETSPLEGRLRAEGMEVVYLSEKPGSREDAEALASLARERGASWVVVDGYHFDAAYQKAVKDAGPRLLVLDDYGHAEHYHADVILNQNICADAALYPNREPYTELLLGINYAILRREFRSRRNWEHEVLPIARRVLVTLGGSDPDNVTLKVVRALGRLQVDGLQAVVVAGGSNPHYDELHAAAAESRQPIRLERNVADMPELMAWADVAVSAGGSTCWELAFMGLPNVVLVLADNQRGIAAGLGEAGVSLNLGWHADCTVEEVAASLEGLMFSADRRAEMSRRGRELVDGLGGARVVAELVKTQSLYLRLRLVDERDCKLLWEWANDPVVRAVSFSSDPIPWEEHVGWFNARLDDPNCVFFVVLNGDGVSIGQVRYDLKGDDAVISVSIAPEFRGRDYGSRAIELASRRLFEISQDIDVIHAYIKPGNAASIRAFTKAGFQDAGTAVVNNRKAVHLILKEEYS